MLCVASMHLCHRLIMHDARETIDSGQLGHIGPGKSNLQNFEPCGCKLFLQLMDLGLDPGKTGIALSVCKAQLYYCANELLEYVGCLCS